MQKESLISPAAGFSSFPFSVLSPAQTIESVGLSLSRDKARFLFTPHPIFPNGRVSVDIASF
ncbi:hypothetical protein FRC02_000852 [Tulasnella sp. 418]|nr:hypothetical protein FRC02_000852 [Tulasnella sp. 418]